METNAVLKIDDQNVIGTLGRAAQCLEADQAHPVLDFSGVRRIDADGLRALQTFAHRADEKKIKATLLSVNVNIYKTLKLARLTRHFAFVN